MKNSCIQRFCLYFPRMVFSEIHPSFSEDSRPFLNSFSKQATELSLRTTLGLELTLKGRPPVIRAIWKNTLVASDRVIPHSANNSSSCFLYSGLIRIWKVPVLGSLATISAFIKNVMQTQYINSFSENCRCALPENICEMIRCSLYNSCYIAVSIPTRRSCQWILHTS